MDTSPDCKGFVISDVDGTLTTVISVWEYLHRRLNRWYGDGDRNLTDFLEGRIDYTEFARRDARAYEGLSRSRLDRMASDIPRRPGLDTMMSFFKSLDWPVALVSSGLDILVNQIPHATIRIANRLQFCQDVCTGRVAIDVPIHGKAAVTARLLESYRLDPAKVIAIGDSRGDIPVMTAAGFSIAVAPVHPDVSSVADAVIDGNNLAEVCDLVTVYRQSAGF